MPYASLKQERYFNANRAKMEAQGVNVDEWNKASKGMKLPMRAPGKVPMPKKTAAPKMVKVPKAKKPPKVTIKPVHGTPLANLLGFNAAHKLLG